MFLRKLGKRGAEMVEYAIVLACIAAVGVGFYSSNDSKLTGVLDSLFGNVRQVLGLEDTKYKYSTPLVDEDKQYQKVMDSLINGIYAALGTTDQPLASVSIGSDGTINSFSVYDTPEGGRTWSRPRTEEQKTAGYANQFLADGYSFSNGHTILNFSPDGKIVSNNIGSKYNDINSISRVYIKNDDGSTKLYYNRLNQNFSSEQNYWQVGIDANTP